MKKYQPLDPTKAEVKLTISQYRERRARAYAVGQFGGGYEPEFEFELEAYNQAKADEATVREFLK